MHNILAGLILLFAFFASSAAMSRLAYWGEKRRIVDVPNERSSHIRPTPRVGGIAIAMVTLMGLALYWALNPRWTWTAVGAYALGASIIACISWLDDLDSISVGVRLVAQGTGAIVAILGLGHYTTLTLPVVGQLHLGWVGVPISFVWIVGLTNAYNFMDGVDGMAGGQALVAGIGWAVLGWVMDMPLVGGLGALLAATCTGFLYHNWQPARIFMGDVGSTFLGYSFAVLPVVAAQTDDRSAVAGILVVWPFVFDSAFTFSRRLRRREDVFAAHRSHLYQRLVIVGYTHRFVTLLYATLALSGLAAAVAFVIRPTESAWLEYLVALVPAAGFVGLWLFVAGEERKSRSFSVGDRG